MAKVQYQIARQLLALIPQYPIGADYPTYGDAAKLLGRRSETNSRAIAQACDLLDAAACLAGTPLLALVKIREKSGKINSKAWKEYRGPRRDAIIERSNSYQFGAVDFAKISDSLKKLEPRGNRSAWTYVNAEFPGDAAYQRVVGIGIDVGFTSNAIDDLDDPRTDTPDRAKTEVWQYARDPQVRDAVLRRAEGSCEFCGRLGFLKPSGKRYLETHHIIALANAGKDRPTNVIALCANDHREAHFGITGDAMEAEMIAKLRRINSKL